MLFGGKNEYLYTIGLLFSIVKIVILTGIDKQV